MLAVALLAGCTNQRAPDNYNGTVRKNFILACQGKNPDQKQTISASQQDCTCIYDRFVKDVPFSRFKKVNDELRDKPGPFPSDMTSIVDSCTGSTATPTSTASSSTSAPG